jgi:hypothetical protein
MLYLRSINRFILISRALLGLSVSSVNAALVTQLLGVDVNGSLYDVTFHDASFNDLWDGDNDGVFESDGSLFDSQPAFWGNASDALVAAQAIMARLGLVDTTSGIGDGFAVPWQIVNEPYIRSVTDAFGTPGGDKIEIRDLLDTLNYNFPYASFASPVSAVPVPAAVWLFGAALIGFIGMSKRRKVA